MNAPRSYREGLWTGGFAGGAWYLFCTGDHMLAAAVLLAFFLLALRLDRSRGYWAGR
jgi:hypothetical protein